MADGNLRLPGTDRMVPLHWILLGIGIVLDLVGLIWILQGVNILPGSFMTGDRFWAYAGGVLTIVGMVLVALAMRRKADYG
jgi:uncharacterized membrane protein